MSDIDDAIRRWWLVERPNIETLLRKAYRVASVSDEALRMFHRGLREAFIAGWNARGRIDDAAGKQVSLLPTEEP